MEQYANRILESFTDEQNAQMEQRMDQKRDNEILKYLRNIDKKTDTLRKEVTQIKDEVSHLENRVTILEQHRTQTLEKK
jgi:ABC-type molybdate transport system ATPase subunit